MPPQSQEMDAFFKNVEKLEGLPGDFDPVEGSDRDFESFFEKLSSLDDMNWSNDTAPEPRADGPKPSVAAQGAKRAVAKVKAPPAKPAAKTGASPRPAARPPATQFARWETAPARPPRGARGNSFAGRAARICKITFLAAALFSTGLVAGFWALSIPNANRPKKHDVSALFNQNGPRTTQTATLQPPTAGQGNSTAAPGRYRPARRSNPAAEERGLTITENGRVKARLTAQNGALRAGRPAARRQAQPATPAPKAPAIAQADGDAKANARRRTPAQQPARKAPPRAAGRYALQVGACQSSACVRAYRSALERHVSPGSISIVVKVLKGAKAPLRRIRVEPLTRADAQALRSILSAADKRFKGAYLIGRG